MTLLCLLLAITIWIKENHHITLSKTFSIMLGNTSIISTHQWLSFLSQTAGKPFKFFFPQISDFEDVMYTDASGSVGFGGVLGQEWCQADWSDDWWHQKNIALLELVPVYIRVVLCHKKLSNKPSQYLLIIILWLP